DELSILSQRIDGSIRLYSKNEQTVTAVKVVLIEKYSRGRGKEKLTDEYQLGEINLNKRFKVPAEGMIEIDFSLPYSTVKSDMDDLADKNLLAGGLVKAMKFFEKVQSEYRLEAEAKVEGVALNPFDRKVIELK
ncbi:MAG: hypothetical protein KDC32_03565, partial [Saprospiraceae bacterium]|nr:hypothetical protein [Saprospiraceae bacterium]